MGHQVTLAENGKEALKIWEERLNNKPFDLILMDVQMPELDGLQATSLIRQKEKTYNIHTLIIALTAYNSRQELQKCLNAGMDDYLVKPFKSIELQNLLKNYFSYEKKNEIESEKKKSPHIPIIDQEELINRFEDDWDLLTELIELFIEERPKMLKELDQAIREKNSTVIKEKAHRMKGVFANFSAKKAWQTAYELEQMGRENKFDRAEKLYQNFKIITDETELVLKELLNEKKSVSELRD